MAKAKKPGKRKKRKVVVKRVRRRRRVGLPAYRVLENNQFRQLDSRLAGVEGRQYQLSKEIPSSREQDFYVAQKLQNGVFEKGFKDMMERQDQQIALTSFAIAMNASPGLRCGTSTRRIDQSLTAYRRQLGWPFVWAWMVSAAYLMNSSLVCVQYMYRRGTITECLLGRTMYGTAYWHYVKCTLVQVHLYRYFRTEQAPVDVRGG